MNVERETVVRGERQERWDIFRGKERLNHSVGRGRCCLEDEFSIQEGSHGWLVLSWARVEKTEGWMTEGVDSTAARLHLILCA